MKIAACVILYHPKEKDLNNILSYIDLVDKLYVYDNSEEPTITIPFDKYDKIIYISDSENKGLSYRLNHACNAAIADGFDFLLTMDQDSYFTENNLKYYFQNIKDYPNKEKIGIFGLDYYDYNKSTDPKKIIPKEVDFLITSGSVMNLNLYKEIGGFDENLFIDGVDYDYCFAVLKNNFKCIHFKNNSFTHTIGEKTKRSCIKTLYLIKKHKLIHSPIRIYYIKRNMLYLEKKYSKLFPKEINKMKSRYSSHIITNILYSEKPRIYFEYRQKGINDFNNDKMGKIEP